MTAKEREKATRLMNVGTQIVGIRCSLFALSVVLPKHRQWNQFYLPFARGGFPFAVARFRFRIVLLRTYQKIMKQHSHQFCSIDIAGNLAIV